jgi:hypothetical protein
MSAMPHLISSAKLFAQATISTCSAVGALKWFAPGFYEPSFIAVSLALGLLVPTATTIINLFRKKEISLRTSLLLAAVVPTAIAGLMWLNGAFPITEFTNLGPEMSPQTGRPQFVWPPLN